MLLWQILLLPKLYFSGLFKIDMNRYSVYEYIVNSKEIITLLKNEISSNPSYG